MNSRVFGTYNGKSPSLGGSLFWLNWLLWLKLCLKCNALLIFRSHSSKCCWALSKKYSLTCWGSSPVSVVMQLSAAGDTGSPEVVVDPQGEVAKIFSNIGVCVVQQCAKLRQQGRATWIFFWIRIRYTFYCMFVKSCSILWGVRDLLLIVSLSGSLSCPVATAVSYDSTLKAIRVRVPGTDDDFYLHPATVRRNDRSAQSIVREPFLLSFEI